MSKLEIQSKALPWYARVPSPGNPADDPSRLEVQAAAAAFGSILESEDVSQTARSLALVSLSA
jgi:hypothetical protein